MSPPARRAAAALVALPAALVAILAASGAEPAASEEIEGSISPTALPRRHPAPVGVRVAVDLPERGMDPEPTLRRMIVDLDRDLPIDTRGLPRCRASLLREARSGKAERLCGEALVGRGRILGAVEAQGQWPQAVDAPLLVFNGPRRDGMATIVLHASARPLTPTVFVHTTRIGPAPGSRFGPRLRIDIPELGGDGGVTAAQLRLNRRWRYRGKERSYVRARCRDGRLIGQMRLRFSDADDLRGGFTRACRVAS